MAPSNFNPTRPSNIVMGKRLAIVLSTVVVLHSCAGRLPADLWTTAEGNLEIVKLLLEYGAEVNAEGGRYGTALLAAAATVQRDPEIVKLLLEHGADVNAQAAFHDAIKGLIPHIVELLKDGDRKVRSDAAVKILNLAEQPAFQDVIMGLIPQVVELLKDGGLATQKGSRRRHRAWTGV
ncbi:hypothetical protein B0H14DRAFT_3460877 [Mycena olivaceomarginata]|nr:hypothetical protein B0H14DRAFT_3460877 [Mycena olivaceomarginata]